MVVGGVVGWFGQRALVAGAVEAEMGEELGVAPMEPSADTEAAEVATCEEVAADLEALAAEVDDKRALRAFQRGQLALVGGVPEVWRVGADPKARAEAIRAEWEAAAEAHGKATVHEVDCSEPPCLLSIEVWGEDWMRTGARFDLVDDVAQAGGLDRPSGGGTTTPFRGVHGPSNLLVLAMGARPDADSPAGRRLDVRIARNLRDLRQTARPADAEGSP